MANYESSLTGPQMDAALMDMALHQSEAFAVGTRDGIDVTPGDVTYHNNSKYYAQQGSIYASQSSSYASSAESSASSASTSANNASNSASDAEADAERAEDAADRAEQIVGGQFVSYGGDQGLSDAQKSQARKNIVAGATNPNLLDNAWWGSGEVVNQRGQSSVTLTGNSQYWIDRWTTIQYNGTATVSLGASGITITPSGSSMGYMRQVIPNGTSLDGKVLTASILLSNGTVYSGTIKRTARTTQVFFDSDGIYLALTNAEMWYVRIGATARTIRAVKLELGTVSTLANDAPPHYAEELAKCQYYCRVLTASSPSMAAVGMAVTATEFRCAFPFVMRTIPTVTFSGTIKGNSSAVSAISTNGTYSGATSAVGLRFTTTGLTTSAPVILYIGADASITLSADL